MTQRQLPGIRKFKRRARRRLRPQKRIRHVSFEVHRCRHGLVERIFSEQWQYENRLDGLDILNKLMPPGFVVTQRDASVAATVVQWLGTNGGTGFLHKCLNLAGESIVTDYSKRPENQYYIASDELSRVRLPSAWYNFAMRKKLPKDELLPEYRLPTHDVVLAHGKLVPEAINLNARPQIFTEAVFRQERGKTTTPKFRELLAARTSALANKVDAQIKVRLFDAARVKLDLRTRMIADGSLPSLAVDYRNHLTNSTLE